MANGPIELTSIHRKCEALLKYFHRYFKMCTTSRNIYRWIRAISHPLCSHSSFSTLRLRSKFIAERIHQMNQNQRKIQFTIDLLPSSMTMPFIWFVRAIWSETHFGDVNISNVETMKKITKIDLMYTYVYYLEHQFTSQLTRTFGCWHIFISIGVCMLGASNSLQNKLRMNGKDALLTA